MTKSPDFTVETEGPRILITRLSAIGDTILTLPMACAIRERFPRAFIAWVVEPAAAPFVQGHPCLDHVTVVKRRWLKDFREVARVRRELQSLRIDVTFDPQSLTKSALAAWLSGARRRIGFARPQGRELSSWLNNVRIAPASQHLVERQLDLLSAIGINQSRVEFRLPEDRSAKQMVSAFCRDAHLGRGYAVINPGAGWDSRIWPADRYGKVARYLGERWNLPTLVTWGGQREKQMAADICGTSGGRALMAPDTRLLELAEFIRRAEIYIGSDSGPLHMAAASGVPCVGLYGPTRPDHSGPFGAGHQVIQAYYQDGSSRQRKGASNDAMQAISSEAVCRGCDDILDAKRRDNRLRCAV